MDKMDGEGQLAEEEMKDESGDVQDHHSPSQGNPDTEAEIRNTEPDPIPEPQEQTSLLHVTDRNFENSSSQTILSIETTETFQEVTMGTQNPDVSAFSTDFYETNVLTSMGLSDSHGACTTLVSTAGYASHAAAFPDDEQLMSPFITENGSFQQYQDVPLSSQPMEMQVMPNPSLISGGTAQSFPVPASSDLLPNDSPLDPDNEVKSILAEVDLVSNSPEPWTPIQPIQGLNSSASVQKVNGDLVKTTGTEEKKETTEGSQGTSKRAKPGERTREESSQGENEEPEFVWEEYLEQTNSVAVPSHAFKHVEASLESGFIKGMKLEVPNKCCKETYWVASVVMTCGQLLRLRFDGYEDDKSADFWCDLMTSEIHPIGWCAQNNQVLQPPEDIKDKFDDWREFLVRSLTGARTAPSYLLDKTTGITPVDQLKPGMRLEIQHPINPLEVWLVKIVENVGGRLYLRFEGLESAGHDFWLFYLNHRLHPVGWAKTQGYTYKPPQELYTEGEICGWQDILQTALKEAENLTFPLAVFREQEELKPHTFQKGWKLEVLSPLHHNHVCPATVVDILNKFYFVVEIDDQRKSSLHRPMQFSCHSHSKVIFPCRWNHHNGIKVTSPKGWHRPEFSWPEYLDYCKAEAAPDSCFNLPEAKKVIEPGMKLEAVNPENPNQICVATVVKVVEPLLWIHLDNSNKVTSSHIEHCESHNLFPVGWCESNEYQLKPPRIVPSSSILQKKVAVVQPETRNWTDEAYNKMRLSHSAGEWCPKIYYNHRCFSGPFLSKGRIASLPKYVGPGPITLVMKEVLSNLISVAYKSCQVLKGLQMEGKPNPSMHQQAIKAKYNGKSYRAIVEICKSTSQLEDFCRQICLKLECCPNLINTNNYNDDCPDKCSQQSKTPYNYYYAKPNKVKKPVGRPPSKDNNGDLIPKKRGRKRKFKILNNKSVSEEREENGSEIDSLASDEIGDENDPDRGTTKYKRKYTHHIPPPTEIKTRGARLPKYSYDRKTHKKILLSHTSRSHHDNEGQRVKEMITKRPDSNRRMFGSSIPVPELHLSSNPLKWSVTEVIKYIKSTECAQLAFILKEQEIDGQALLLLSLPVLQEHLDLKLGPAIKLCHHIEKIKLAFYRQYAT